MASISSQSIHLLPPSLRASNKLPFFHSDESEAPGIDANSRLSSMKVLLGVEAAAALPPPTSPPCKMRLARASKLFSFAGSLLKKEVKILST